MRKISKDDLSLFGLAICLILAICTPIIFVFSMFNKPLPTVKSNIIQEDLKSKNNDETIVTNITDEKQKEEKKEETTTVMPTINVPDSTKCGREFYRNSLTVAERKIYDEIYQNIVNFNSNSFKVPAIDYASVKKIYNYVLIDNEELFQFNSLGVMKNSSDIVSSINIKFNMDKQTYISIKATIDDITIPIVNKMKGMSEYEKVKYVHNYIINNTRYILDSENNQDIRSVFIGKQSVCAGYARAFQYLLRKSGVYCIYITGTSKESSDAAALSHAWNLVRINNKYYYVDVTFDDPYNLSSNSDLSDILKYTYLNITTENLLKNHAFDISLPELPVANSTEDNYYVKEDLYFEKYDANVTLKIISDISKGTETKNRYYSYKFNNNETFNEAVNSILNSSTQLHYILSSVNAKVNVTNKIVSDTINYSLDEENNIINIIVSYV